MADKARCYGMFLCLLALTQLAHSALQGSIASGVGDYFTMALAIGDSQVEITMVGEASKWFAFGFGSEYMEGTYAVIAFGETSVTDNVLSKSGVGDQTDHQTEHSSIVVVEDSVTGFYRTVRILRPLETEDYTFPSEPGPLVVMSATAIHGTPQTIPSYHGSMQAVDTIDLVEVTEPIAVAAGCCRSLDLQNTGWKQDCSEAAIERQCEMEVSSFTGENKCLWLEPCTLDAIATMEQAQTQAQTKQQVPQDQHQLQEHAQLQPVEDADASRCEWDGTGAGDALRMQELCARYTEEECVAAGQGNKDARCTWRARVHAREAEAREELMVRSKGLDQVMGSKVVALVLVLGAAALIMVAFTLRQVYRALVERPVAFELWEGDGDEVYCGKARATTPLLV